MYMEFMMPLENEGEFGEYRRLILQELQRSHDGIIELKGMINNLSNRDIADIKAEIAVLKFKSGLWGFVAGAIPSAVAVIYAVMKP